MVTPIHKEFYIFPHNEFLNWNNWNCLYDFVSNNQDHLWGRTQLLTHIDCFRASVRRMNIDKKIDYFDRKQARDRKAYRLKISNLR